MIRFASARSTALLLVLAVVMLTTRQYDYYGMLPDASWAVFFLGGFYLGGRYIFAAFMLAAVAIDYIATQHLGVSSYCLSPAYVFLLPAYATLWLAGRGSARHWHREALLRSLVRLSASLIVAVSLCFLISNSSFYWLSGRVTAPSLPGWLANVRQWYGYFLAVPCAYVALAVLAHGLLARWAERAPAGVRQH